MRRALLLLACLLLAPLAPPASAHGGVVGPGTSLATATAIGAPAYLFLDAEEGPHAYYYRAKLEGEVRLRLLAPEGRAPEQAPVLFLFGPGLPEAAAPPEIERPPEAGGLAFPASGVDAHAMPAIGITTVALVDRALALDEGEFVLVVRTTSPGPLALSIETPPTPWIAPFLMPGLRDEARAWAALPAWPGWVAGALAGLAVVAVAWLTRARRWTMHAVGAFAFATLGMMSAGSLASVSARTGVGWGYVAAAVALSAAALASTWPSRAPAAWWQRALLAAVGLAGFWACAGSLWGPVAALAGAALPEK